MAMQFQDITSQQICHSIDLLEDLRGHLNQMLALINGEELPDSLSSSQRLLIKKVYDPNADYSSKRTEQADVDSIFEGRGDSVKE